MAIKAILPGLATAFLLFIASTQTAVAQTAAELERILALPAVSYGDAAWLVLGTAGTPEDFPGDAYRFAEDKGWLPKKAVVEETITLGSLSFLIMRAFNLKGGLMYALFPGPRYACREMQALGFLRGRVYPSNTVSGAEFLQILGEALSYAGDEGAGEAALLPGDEPKGGSAAGPENVQGYDGEFRLE
jgi:hypothetical protein